MTEKVVLIESCVVGKFRCPKCGKLFVVRHTDKSNGKMGHRLGKD